MVFQCSSWGRCVLLGKLFRHDPNVAHNAWIICISTSWIQILVISAEQLEGIAELIFEFQVLSSISDTIGGQGSGELLRINEILLALCCAYWALADLIGERVDSTCQVDSIAVSAVTMSATGWPNWPRLERVLFYRSQDWWHAVFARCTCTENK